MWRLQWEIIKQGDVSEGIICDYNLHVFQMLRQFILVNPTSYGLLIPADGRGGGNHPPS